MADIIALSDPVPADTESAPATPAVVAPAPEAAARKVGFLARIMGAQDSMQDLENRLQAESAAHAATQQQLATAHARIAEFEALEARLEQEATAARAEAATAQAAVASVPQQVAAQVAAVVETLGVTEAALPAVQADPPKGDFSHLTGRDRAAAAFNAQFSS